MIPPLLVIDGDSFAHRSDHALPKTIRRRGNRGGGAVVGFANFLLRLYESERPRAVLVGWDTLDEPTYRHRALESCQTGREFDTELVDQLEILPEFVAACGFANAKQSGYEADDFLAAAVAKGERRGPVLVATGDRDAYQLASAKTTILQPIKAGEMAKIGPAEVRERYGVEPAQVPDFMALRGDASDKIPGAKGVGPRTAAGLLVKYGSLDKLLAAGRFPGQAEELRPILNGRDLRLRPLKERKEKLQVPLARAHCPTILFSESFGDPLRLLDECEKRQLEGIPCVPMGAHRTLIFRKLKSLEPLISLSVVHWLMGADGWAFEEGEGVILDTVNGARYLRDFYTSAGFVGQGHRDHRRQRICRDHPDVQLGV